MGDSRGGCPAAPPHSHRSQIPAGRAGHWRGVRAAAQPGAAGLPLLSRHRPGEGCCRVGIRLCVYQNTHKGGMQGLPFGYRAFPGHWVGAEEAVQSSVCGLTLWDIPQGGARCSPGPKRPKRCGCRSRQSPAPSSARLSDLHLRNDVVRIELWCFNVVTATFPRHISS